MTSTSPSLSRFTGAARHALTALALACASTAALADRFAISHTGTITNSTFPHIHAGERFSIWLVLDNGGTSAASQSWDANDVKCIIWQMNDAKDERISFDFTGAYSSGAGIAQPTITTHGNGELNDVFSEFTGNMMAPHTGLVVSTGGSTSFANGAVEWKVRSTYGGDTTLLNDTVSSVDADTQTITLASAWTTPRAVDNAADCATLAGNLAAAPAAAPTSTAAIPVLGAPGLVLLGTLTGLLGWRRMGSRARRSA